MDYKMFFVGFMVFIISFLFLIISIVEFLPDIVFFASFNLIFVGFILAAIGISRPSSSSPSNKRRIIAGGTLVAFWWGFLQLITALRIGQPFLLGATFASIPFMVFGLMLIVNGVKSGPDARLSSVH